MNKKQREKQLNTARTVLLCWTLFIGIGAMCGGIAMLVEPSGTVFGFKPMLADMKKLPLPEKLFDNFIFSGIMLITVNGITNLLASAFLFAKKKAGYILGTIFGVTLMLWIIIQFCIFEFNFLSTAYFFFGLFQAIAGACCLICHKQSLFTFDQGLYKNIASNKNEVVFYFSRNGYTKKIAYELADKSGATVCEITSPERVGGTSGFWWCGRFGMHGWQMPINPVDFDFSAVESVVVVSPVWVFGVASPVLTFLNQNAPVLLDKSVKIVLNGFNKHVYKRTKKQLAALPFAFERRQFYTRLGSSKEYGVR